MTNERTFITTTSLEGIRPLAWQGVQAITCHAQLVSLLEARLSSAHAAFLAEPLMDQMGHSADWYTPLQGDVRKLSELPVDEQQIMRARIADFAVQMQALAAELQKMTDSNSRMAGTLLELALSYPSEDFLYRVGDQPVLICWGCAPGNIAAAPEPLTRLAAFVPPPPAPPPKPVAEATAAPVSAAQEKAHRKAPLPWWLLFFLLGFLLCLLAMPWLLPRLGLPSVTLDFLPGGCSAPPPVLQAENLEGLHFSQDKEKALREELKRLQDQYAQRLNACPPKEAKVEPPPPEVKPEPKPEPEPEVATLPLPEPKPEPPPLPEKKEQPQNLSIPDNANNMSFLEGCWLADIKEKLKNVRTGLPVSIKYCFDKNGKGTALVQEFDAKGRKMRECKGSASARMTPDNKLVITDGGTVTCPDGAKYNRTDVRCTEQGARAICTRTNPPHNWSDVPFTRTTR